MKLNTRIFPLPSRCLSRPWPFPPARWKNKREKTWPKPIALLPYVARTWLAAQKHLEGPGAAHHVGLYGRRKRGLQLLTAAISPEEKERVAQAGIFPTAPILSNKKWASIYKYYYTTAPDTLALPSLPGAKPRIGEALQAEPRFFPGSPDVTLLKFNPASKTLWCHFKDGTLAALDPQFNLADTSTSTARPPTWPSPKTPSFRSPWAE